MVLVPHSAGTTLVVKWSFEQPEAVKKVAGVFFVAPSDRDRPMPPGTVNTASLTYHTSTAYIPR